MEQIRIIVEQEITRLGEYEQIYRKLLQKSDGSDTSEQVSHLQQLDDRISTIRSWLSYLSTEEYLVICASLVEKKPLTAIVARYQESFGCLPHGGEEAVYRHQDKALDKISMMIFEEYESAIRFAESLSGEIPNL